MVWDEVDARRKSQDKLLAEKKGVSQKEAVMNLVNEEVVEYKVKPKPGSMLEKMQKYVG